ncbi:MAG TPA: hypothetical protein ENK23_06235, partial [Sorangium sp.]|nr:hypothetical protein [Sorangium sp.]
MTTNHHRHAQQLLAQALAATTLQQRRQALRAALAQQRAALATATATATQSPETVARVWLQAGILRLLQGALPAAKAACLSARPGLANPREVDWLEAEVAVLAGDHADAMQLLLPRLDDAP